jgi:serine/threonine protein kinase
MTPRSEGDVLAVLRATKWTPPERCSTSADPPTEACDVWSLAATLYFAVSRLAPRGAATSLGDLARAPVRPVREAAPTVSEGFAALIEHALAADPAARYESAYAMLGDVRRVMAGRKPKLEDAQRPNPSGSYTGPPPHSSRRHLSGARTESSVLQPVMGTSTGRESVRPRPSEWKGNLAIATLVGVATFVMVRERVEEERMQRAHPVRTGDSARAP